MIELVDINGCIRGYCDTLFGSGIFADKTLWHRGVSLEELEIAREGFENSTNFLVAFVISSHGSGEDIDCSCFDMVFVMDQEVIDQPVQPRLQLLREKFNNTNLRIITASTLEQNTNVYCFPGLLYVSVRNQIFEESPNNDRPFKFESLMGLQKPHRDMLFRMIKDSGYLDQTLINLTTNFWHVENFETVYRSPELDQYEDPSLVEMFANRTFCGYDTFPNQEHFMKSLVAQMIPWQVYHASWYSLVTETWPNRLTFFTEKTTKPLFAKRIFWLFGCKGMLAKLREYGFCTFSSIVDESYDDIDDDFERLKAAYESAVFISNKDDPVKVYNHLKPELEYNHNLITQKYRVEAPLANYIKVETEKAYNDRTANTKILQ